MTKLEAALLDLSTFLDESRIPYMVIGGFANLFWGVERFTKDIDITVGVPADGLSDLLGRLRARFTLTVPDPEAFARRNHLIRLRTGSGVEADLIMAVLPYEFAAIGRAVAVEVGGRPVRVCSPEDLIIHKLASDRPQDAVDVEGIVLRQAAKLDRTYLWPRVRELATGLDRPTIVEFLEAALRKADARA
ncbi:MAG: nucleotidyl transferase AbiEii/AbiGii toxin family protein [Candidatus Eisenbacteria bacterium]